MPEGVELAVGVAECEADNHVICLGAVILS